MTRQRRSAAATITLILTLAGLTTSLAAPAFAGHGGTDHWSKDGLAHAQIYVVDLTGPDWPVATKVYKWNEAYALKGAKVNMYYETSCPSTNLHCVRVRTYTNGTAPNAGCVGSYGCTLVSAADSNNHHTLVRVYLNNTTVTTVAQHKKTTCHELGHVFTLVEKVTPDNGTCMTQGVSPPIAEVPDDHDYSALYTKYNHGN